MAFKLAVSDTIEVPVIVDVRDGGKTVTHRFNVLADRMPQEELKEIRAEDATPVNDLLLQKVKGWSGQRLVLGDDNQPAPFSREAFECLLGMAGMSFTIFNSYLNVNFVAATPEGRRKN